MLHEYHWAPPASLAKPYTEEQIKELKKRYDERGGSKKETVYDMIKREKKKVRLREVWDQKANSVADLAAVLKEQETVREEMEEGFDQRRNGEVKEMLRLVKEMEGGAVDKLKRRTEALRPYLERREGSRIEDGARISQRQAKKRAWTFKRRIERMQFAAQAMEDVKEVASILDKVEEDLQSEISALENRPIEAEQAASVTETSKDEVGQIEQPSPAEVLSPSEQPDPTNTESVEDPNSQKEELEVVLSGARQAKIEFLKYGPIGLETVKDWIDNPRYAPVEGAATNASEMTEAKSTSPQATNEESNASQTATAEEDAPETTNADHDELRTNELRNKIKGYQLVLTAVSAPDSEQRQIFNERMAEKEGRVVQKKVKNRALEQLVTSKEERRKAKTEEMADSANIVKTQPSETDRRKNTRSASMRFASLEMRSPVKLRQIEQEMAELERQAPSDRQDSLARLQNHKAVIEAQLEAFDEVRAIRARAELNVDNSSVVDMLEKRLLELTRGFEAEDAEQVEGEHHTMPSRVLLGQHKVFRFALGAERGWHADHIYTDTKKNSVYMVGTKIGHNGIRLPSEYSKDEASEQPPMASQPPKIDPAGQQATPVSRVIEQDQAETAPTGMETTAREHNSETGIPASPRWPPALASFPPEPTPPQDLFPRKEVKSAKRKSRVQKAPLFTMQGVKVKFNNVLDAEFAEEWPEDVIIEGMGLTKGMSAPRADDQPIYGEVEWREKQREIASARSRRGVIQAFAESVVGVVKTRGNQGLVEVPETQIVVKDEKQVAPPNVENQEVVMEEKVEMEQPYASREDRSSIASKVRGWFGR